MKSISNELTQKILSLLSSGITTRECAEKTGVGKSTVGRVRAKNRDQAGSPSVGRRSIVSSREQRSIIRSVTSGGCDTAVDMAKRITETSGKKISAQTVRNILKQNGLVARVKKKRPLLSKRNRKLRLEFAQKYSQWTVSDWKKIIFSDETKINRLGSDGRKWIWKKKNASLTDREVIPTLKFGGGSLMLWGCFLYSGVGCSCRIEGNMDAKLYAEILEGEFLQTLDHYSLDKSKIIFQQDNDPKHKSRLAMNWFKDNGIELLDWPPQSPDLNPIEHIWDYLKRKLNAYGNPAEGIHELWERVQTEWENIPTDFCYKLIKSMPSRIASVLKVKGGYTKY